MNTFGNKLKITIFGESHGAMIGVVVDGVRPGLPLAQEDFHVDMARRRSGAVGTTPRRETDRLEIVSGVWKGLATGAPVTIMIRNIDTQSSVYEKFVNHPRPSHADFAASVKYQGFNDPRGGGQFSGRMTAALTAAGVIAKKMLPAGVEITSRIVETGDVAAAQAAGDSVGGIVECTATGLPAGLGEPFFDTVEGVLAHILFAIPAVRGVEFGAGFAAARMLGSEHNDPLIDAAGRTATNHAGGINGGITNGNPLVVRVAVKPTPSIALPQLTFNRAAGAVEPLAVGGRHDTCIALRAPVVVEAAVAIGLAQFA